jgi:hypothetical protein
MLLSDIILISKDLDHWETEMDFVTKSCVLICAEEQTEVFEIHFFFDRNVLS